jgi:CDGSH-type Zn-finger protein
MTDVSILVRDNGPYIVRGVRCVRDSGGTEYDIAEVIALCRCGKSSNKPFCDGTHNVVGFDSAPRAGS